MRNVDKLWRKSIFNRLILSFLCILFPIFLLSVIIYQWGVQTIRDEISNSMISQVSFYLDGLEKEVKRIRTLQYDFLNDDDLNQLATIPESMSEIEKVQSILRLQQRLRAIQNSSAYIKNVFVLIPAVDKKINASTFTRFDADEFEKLRDIPLTPDAQFITLQGDLYLSAIYPYASINKKKPPLFVLAVELSKEQMQGALGSMVNGGAEGVVLFNRTTNAMIAAERHDSGLDGQIQAFIEKQTTDAEKKAATVKFDGKKYLAVYSISEYMGSLLIKYIPEASVFQSLKKYQIWFPILLVVALVTVVLYSLYTYRYIYKPLIRLARSFRKVENGDLSIAIEHKNDDEYRYIYGRFNAMVENLSTLIDQVYKQRILTQKAELKQLQSQINPHFLYNSFFILKTMSRIGDYESLERFTDQLGEYFHFVTRSAADELPLSAEVHHARIYTDIQAMRFSNRIAVIFEELPPAYAKLMVPRLILQPLIENAFEHGLNRLTENGLLHVGFVPVKDGLDLIVEDNGNGLEADALGRLKGELTGVGEQNEITGIANIHRRIRLKFGSESGIGMMRSASGGLKVAIHIRFREEDHDVQTVDR
ncbi:sensor histidine kinase [Cohnella sp. GCM10020058]|uniref:sensor histidine kinase n=1 Tax=Cohnella sp. GCM10020058 TaxID=3317330 RepID=UPI00363501D9